MTRFTFLFALMLTGVSALEVTRAKDPEKDVDARAHQKPSLSTQAALEKLKLPGIKINLKEHSVDVAAKICLEQGTLELVACTKNSKEHESIVAVEAKAMHIHTALLLLGAPPGNPAMRKPANEEQTRWIDVTPRGGLVDVFLVFKNKEGKLTERPISDFIAPADPAGLNDEIKEEKKNRFPTHTFLFAGSHLVPRDAGPPDYLCDRSGNVISITTFGDELLCLPEIHSHKNGSLLWQVDNTHLPKVGSKVTLRLRPKLKK